MAVTQRDVPARLTLLAPPEGASALASTEPPREEAASGLSQKAVREPFDFNEYVEFLQYAEWGWF